VDELRMFETNVLRGILECKKGEQLGYCIHNEELLNICSSLGIFRAVNLQKLQWAVMRFLRG
jgi:hypothetical protein